MPVVRFKYHHTSLKLFIKIIVNTTVLVNIIIIMFVVTWQAELCGLPAQPLLRLWLAQLGWGRGALGAVPLGQWGAARRQEEVARKRRKGPSLPCRLLAPGALVWQSQNPPAYGDGKDQISACPKSFWIRSDSSFLLPGVIQGVSKLWGRRRMGAFTLSRVPLFSCFSFSHRCTD